MKRLINLEDPFFKPVWIRVATVLVSLAWGIFEVMNGAVLWATIFLGIAGICAWRFSTIDYDALDED